MNPGEELNNEEKWLAAEFALGALDGDDFARAQGMFERDRRFRREVEAWNIQFEPLLQEVREVSPPAAVWNRVEERIAPQTATSTSTVGLPNAASSGAKGQGAWKVVTALMSTLAVACFGLLMYFTGGDFSGTETHELQQQIASLRNEVEQEREAAGIAAGRVEQVESQAAALRSQLEARRVDVARAQEDRDELRQQLQQSTGDSASQREEIATLAQSLAQARDDLELARENARAAQGRLVEVNRQLSALEGERQVEKGELDRLREALSEREIALADANSELARLNDRIATTKPLIAALSQSGDAPAFVAQYDPLKQALLIRTAVTDVDEKVPEIWLIPGDGERKGDVLSLGVMDENKPDELKIAPDLLPLIGEGGTLAITMEPPGGSPNGVATGPVIALGTLQGL